MSATLWKNIVIDNMKINMKQIKMNVNIHAFALSFTFTLFRFPFGFAIIIMLNCNCYSIPIGIADAIAGLIGTFSILIHIDAFSIESGRHCTHSAHSH